jgi:hypothetical protein
MAPVRKGGDEEDRSRWRREVSAPVAPPVPLRGDHARALGLLHLATPRHPVVSLLQAPSKVVIFDEFDRAHPRVRDVLYQLPEGRITILEGKLVSTAAWTKSVAQRRAWRPCGPAWRCSAQR